jgi:Flp pilus assembly pilin Flp
VVIAASVTTIGTDLGKIFSSIATKLTAAAG